MNQFDVDIPVTDLDDEEDLELYSENEEQVLDDDFSKSKKKSRNIEKLKNKIKKQANRLTNNDSYQRLETQNESIELQDVGNDINTNMYTIQSLDTSSKKGSNLKTLIFCGVAMSFLGVLIGMSVLVSNMKQDSVRSLTTFKPVLSNGTDNFYPTTVLISLDGFHPHYISEKHTPYMHKFYMKSAGPAYMIPSFPSSTFPNHWSMVTGLYPIFHGIVGNTFFSPKLQKQFVNVKPEFSISDSAWWGGEPLWQTAYKHGVSASVHMWPGSEVEFPTGNALEVDKYNGSEVLSAKASRIVEWIDRKLAARPELILGYVPTIDSLGHKYGVEGTELEEGLSYVDNFVETVHMAIEQRNLSHIVNLVLVSDHGMAPTSNERVIFLDDLVPLEMIEHFDGWPLFGLRPFSKYNIEEVYSEIEQKIKQNGYRAKVYLKGNMPREWNFGNTNSQYDERLAPIWVVPDVGYAIITKEKFEKLGRNYSPKGVHGYNNTETLMRALFMAKGPYFSDKKAKVEPFENVNVYNIICDSLNLHNSAANNGTELSNIWSKTLLNWTDPEEYPGVDFEMKIEDNSTYDALFRVKNTEKLPSTSLTVSIIPTSSSVSSEKLLDISVETSSLSVTVSSSTSIPSEAAGIHKDKSWFEAVEDAVEDAIEKVGDEAKHIIEEIGHRVEDFEKDEK